MVVLGGVCCNYVYIFLVVVASSDIVGLIVGGSRHISKFDDYLTLDCLSSSFDPDDVPGDLSCDWTCHIGIGGCISQTTQDPLVLGNDTIQIDPSELRSKTNFSELLFFKLRSFESSIIFICPNFPFRFKNYKIL